MLLMPAGFDFGTTTTSVLRVKTTGFSTTPDAESCAGNVVFADAKTSAGAPFVIWVARPFEPPNEYVLLLSIAGKTSVSEAAAYTVTPACAVVDFAAALPATRDAQSIATSVPRMYRTICSFLYEVKASIAADAWSIVSAGGNATLKALRPFLVHMYERGCASHAAISASPCLNELACMPPTEPR